MKLRKLTLKDAARFSRFLSLSERGLSNYSFANIYIWKKLFDIEWVEIEGNLCVFFQDRISRFLYLVPLGKAISPRALSEAFGIMDSCNKDPQASRIENAQQAQVDIFRRLGYCVKEKSGEYLCLREDLVKLQGDRFKSKRASVNFFKKNYSFAYLPYKPPDRQECLRLYQQWMRQRAAGNSDALYRGMLGDNLACLKVLLADYTKLKISGRVIKIGGKIKAFTFGFAQNKDTFCILYEITDLSVKGSAQFIFREFCLELSGYKYINIMDDSGLTNLRRVKLSYHPVKVIPAYIVTRKNE